MENLSTEAVAAAAQMLRTLAHPMRLRIVDAVSTAGAMPVCDLSHYLDISQAATSQHLGHMRRVGLLQSQRRGKEVWYSVADARPIALLHCICSGGDGNG